jgi:hypothetical protein
MLLVLAASVCLLAPTSASAVTFPGAISGTVTDGQTAEPIADLEVCAYPLNGEEEGEEEWRCSETDEAGEYEVTNLAEGEWKVEFWGPPLGYMVQYWQGKGRWSEADPVVVEATALTGIDAELLPGGEVQGTVRAAAGGATLEEIEVCAWGYPGEFFAGCTLTDSAGEYALRGLSPAEYEIGFYPGESSGLLAQYYDHKENWWEADLVPVEAEEIVTGIDADLNTGAQISGSVYSDATGAPLSFIYVCSIDAPNKELWDCTETDENGHYVLDRLPGGSYKVVFSIDFEQWYGEEFGGEESDGFPTEFWDNQSTLAAANVISLAPGQSVTGIDAHLGSPASPPSSGGSVTVQVLVPPAALPAPQGTAPTTAPKHKHCRKGFKRKKVKGKYRCVKRKKHRPRHRAGRAATAAAADTALLPSFGQRQPDRLFRHDH